MKNKWILYSNYFLSIFVIILLIGIYSKTKYYKRELELVRAEGELGAYLTVMQIMNKYSPARQNMDIDRRLVKELIIPTTWLGLERLIEMYKLETEFKILDIRRK